MNQVIYYFLRAHRLLTQFNFYAFRCGPSNVVDCAADGSQKKIEDLCNGKRKCTINPSYTVFSDPCFGTTKYVEVKYECIKGEIDAKLQ